MLPASAWTRPGDGAGAAGTGAGAAGAGAGAAGAGTGSGAGSVARDTGCRGAGASPPSPSCRESERSAGSEPTRTTRENTPCRTLVPVSPNNRTFSSRWTASARCCRTSSIVRAI
ncbi:hypothetical protein DAT35_07550 [Vitiosangium sp. GDMCC 1.1324]|nr:hypothetical protein DAT35_07550 [Vitiosangium sp. GDMCC 1.1324]